jgi:hypothetical protein
MLGTLLGITVPLFYLFAACGIARFVAVSSNTNDDLDRHVVAVAVGLFWPVALPFYVALHNT